MGKERLGTEDFRDLLMDREALNSISKVWSYTTDLISFITSQGHTAYLTVIGERPAAANRRRTNFQQLPLTRTSNTQTSERDFVWQNWKKFQILYYIQCEAPLYWRALVCRDVAHCHWATVTDTRQTELFYVWQVGKIIFVRLAALRSTAHVLLQSL